MANSARYGWRLPDATDAPVVHLDVPNLAADIEDTLYTTPQLVSGFPKFAGPADISGWLIKTTLVCYKWKLRDNLYMYEFSGYIGRTSSYTLAAGAAGITLSNFMDTDINVNGGVPDAPATLAMFPIQGGGSTYNGVQVMINGRDMNIRSVGNVSLTTAHYIAVNLYRGYGTT